MQCSRLIFNLCTVAIALGMFGMASSSRSTAAASFGMNPTWEQTAIESVKDWRAVKLMEELSSLRTNYSYSVLIPVPYQVVLAQAGQILSTFGESIETPLFSANMLNLLMARWHDDEATDAESASDDDMTDDQESDEDDAYAMEDPYVMDDPYMAEQSDPYMAEQSGTTDDDDEAEDESSDDTDMSEGNDSTNDYDAVDDVDNHAEDSAAGINYGARESEEVYPYDWMLEEGTPPDSSVATNEEFDNFFGLTELSSNEIPSVDNSDANSESQSTESSPANDSGEYGDDDEYDDSDEYGDDDEYGEDEVDSSRMNDSTSDLYDNSNHTSSDDSPWKDNPTYKGSLNDIYHLKSCWAQRLENESDYEYASEGYGVKRFAGEVYEMKYSKTVGHEYENLVEDNAEEAVATPQATSSTAGNDSGTNAEKLLNRYLGKNADAYYFVPQTALDFSQKLEDISLQATFVNTMAPLPGFYGESFNNMRDSANSTDADQMSDEEDFQNSTPDEDSQPATTLPEKVITLLYRSFQSQTSQWTDAFQRSAVHFSLIREVF